MRIKAFVHEKEDVAREGWATAALYFSVSFLSSQLLKERMGSRLSCCLPIDQFEMRFTPNTLIMTCSRHCMSEREQEVVIKVIETLSKPDGPVG